MIKNEYILKVDLKKKHTAVTPTFVQYDEAVLRFLISDNGKPFFFSGQTSIKTYHKRKDGVVVEGEARVEVVKGIQQIVYEYSGNEMYQLGYVDTSLVIYSGNKKVSIQPFKVLIVDSLYDDIATPANPEYGALQHLIASVEDLVKKVDVKITEANKAIDNANNAAENVQTTISEWKYADTYNHATDYKKNNVVSYNGSTFIAIRDTKGNYPIGNLSDANWRIMALKGQDGVVVLNKEDFKATLNQTDFTLPLEYDQHQGRVRVIVDGVEQFTPDNFVELSSTKIRMNSGLRKDADVKVIYFGNAPALKNDIQLQIDNINDLLEFFNLAEANAAITHATTQGDYAKVQGDYAKLKGDATIAAVTQANTARDSANSAATSANTAATNANTAKDAAITATNKANTATALVESATLNANTATTNAITAANDANTAKNNANQAAVNANDAVANMSPKGAYSSTTNYLPRNIISYLGSSYMNIVASKGVLPTVTANWQPVASKGDKGDTGFGFTWKKEYNPTTAYIKDDVVYYNGSSYIALKSVTGITPSNDNINWNIITQRGLDGAGSVSSVNNLSPDLNGNISLPLHEHANKSVIDALSDDAGKLKYNGNVVGSVVSVNGQTGTITGLETVTDSNTKLGSKVDKVAGKGLSTNDYTTAEKDKLTSIATNANNYAHPTLTGYKHVPSGGATGNFLKYKEDGTAEWATPTSSDITESPSKKFTSDTKIAQWDAKATPEYVDNKIGVLSENVVSKTLINKASGVAGLDEFGMIPSTMIVDTATQQSLNQALDDMDTHRTNSGIHVTADEKLKIANASQDGHSHTIDKVTGLQTALDSKTPLSTSGDLTTLTTEDKTSLVNALNEVNQKPSGGSEYVLFHTINGTGSNVYLTVLNNMDIYKKVKVVFKGAGRRADSATSTAYTIGLMIGTSGSSYYAQQSLMGSVTADTTRINLINVAANGSNVQKYVHGQAEIFLDLGTPYVESTMWNIGNWNGQSGQHSGYTVEKFTKILGYRTFSTADPVYQIQLIHPELYLGAGIIEFWGVLK